MLSWNIHVQITTYICEQKNIIQDKKLRSYSANLHFIK